MKKILIVAVFAFMFSGLFAQENVFLQREFWGENPSVASIKEKIKEGNDPKEFNRSHFDGVTIAILADAPVEAITYLLNLKEVDVNKRTHDGRSYLVWAAYKGNFSVIKYLVDHGADVNAKGTHGFGAITFAAYAGVEDQRIYDYLTDNGLSIQQKTKGGATAILLIMQKLKNLEMINYFKKKGLDLNSKDDDGNGAFHYAAKGGNIKVMHALIESGIDYKTKNKLGGNAILVASQGMRGASPKLETFKYLEKTGINPNIVNKNGETPLILLSRRNKDVSLIKYFLEKGVDANQTNTDGNNALINAAAGNNLEIVKILEERTTNKNHQNNEGQTALMKAVSGNSIEVVSYLIKKGAKIDVQDKDGNNLIYYWANSAKRSRDGKVTPPKKEKLTLLLENGLELTKPQPNGNTLLHVAVQNNNLELAQQAIDWDVAVNAKNKEENTALLLAALNAKDTKILKYLLANGADKSMTTEFDESAYDLARENEVLSKKNASIDFLK
ncbi:ankyrin repeat domain-containing protein [Mesonia aestuariivivens]|uniref:Ankyrin repeat domain-containing protein n=1 Tax=Mesonia aestuariivivens TaxID=2796128 RepID=A0ABS6W289_9FLAO|nr:ankyrin repeat domain-containing protein [Mesonia aestuariivivens]MBW2961966.1 ankyrin repeat domain-containing protein [Mesonia aestuariivivens]